jgi:hypothetical protein
VGCIRSVVHGGRPLQVVGGAVDHAGLHDVLVLGVHGVIHHHAVVPLFVLHLGKVLSRLSVPVTSANAPPWASARQAYPCVLDVRGVFCGAVHPSLGRLVNVPELHPPVEQERVVCELVLGQLRLRHRFRARLFHCVDAIRPDLGAELLLGPDAHLDARAVEHGPGRREVFVAQQVVVDVRVELLARVHGRSALGVRQVAHHGGAVDGPSVGVHGRHLRHLLGVVHRDAVGRGGLRQAHSVQAAGNARGGGWQGTRWLGHLGAAVDVVIVTWTAVATGVRCRRGAEERGAQGRGGRRSRGGSDAR